MLSRIPLLDEATLKARRGRFEQDGRDGDDDGAFGSNSKVDAKVVAEVKSLGVLDSNVNNKGASNLLDLDDIFGAAPAKTLSTTTGSNGANTRGAAGADLLSDIFSTPAPQSTPNQASLGDFLSQPAPIPPTSAPAYGAYPVMGATPLAPAKPTITAFEKDGLSVIMELTKPNPSDPQTSHLLCRFTNSNATPITNLLFQCAVPKYVKLEMSPASGTTVAPNRTATVEQLIKVQNSMVGQKALQLKIKVQYNVDGMQANEMGQISNFPPGF